MINNEYINLISKGLGISSSEIFKKFHLKIKLSRSTVFLIKTTKYFLNRNNISEKE